MKLLSNLLNFSEDTVGLDINFGRIVAAHFVPGDGAPVLHKLAAIRYDPELSDKKLALTLRRFWKKAKLPSRTVCTCLHSRALAIRPFSYKNLNLDELANALSLEAEEALQKHPGEISLDWHLAPTAPDESGHRTELAGTLVAAPLKTVQRHLNLIKAAGLYSVSVETSCTALYRLYCFLTRNQAPEPVCAVNLGERTADILMCSNGNSYPRTIFSAGDGWEDNADYLVNNIQDALLYYDLKRKHAPVSKILLTGQIADPDALTTRLQEETSLPVEIWDIISEMERSGADPQIRQTAGESYSAATALGLGLRRPAE
jgi:Tfp pilus assembly PilM family ATPase